MGKPHEKGGGASNLHTAARNGDLRTVESICNSNPLAVNSRDRHSRTPLHLAAWSGQTEVVKFLCKNKADVGASAMDDTGAIHFAAQKGQVEIVRILLSSGISVKSANRKGMTSLHYAVQGSHLELIKYLLRKGASLGARTKSGQTPLDLASNEEVRSLLADCEQTLDIDENPSTAKEDKEPVSEQSTEEENHQGATVTSDVANEADTSTVDKRKDKETSDDASPASKKARVSLQHLLTEDDDQDAEQT